MNVHKYREFLVPARTHIVVSSLTPRSVLVGAKTPSSLVCYIELVQLSHASHISHPTKTATMVKSVPPLLAWV